MQDESASAFSGLTGEGQSQWTAFYEPQTSSSRSVPSLPVIAHILGRRIHPCSPTTAKRDKAIRYITHQVIWHTNSCSPHYLRPGPTLFRTSNGSFELQASAQSDLSLTGISHSTSSKEAIHRLMQIESLNRPPSGRRVWAQREDDLWLRAVRKFGSQKWADSAKLVPNCTSKQYREL
jgi:hypothetical protein